MIHKRIGLIGGAGAYASQHILHEIFNQSIHQHHIKSDEQFPDILLHNVPFHDFNQEAYLNQHIFNQLVNTIKIFEYAQCQKIAIACNTMHSFIPELQKISSLKFINLIELSALACQEKQMKKVMVFCSHQSSLLQLHRLSFKLFNIEVVYPETHEQFVIDNIIGKTIINQQTKEDTEQLNCLSQYYLNNGVDGVVLGCTELSLLDFKGQKIIDSSSLLVQNVINYHFLES